MSILKSKSFYIAQTILIIAGFSELLLADCYYVPYLFVLILGILSLYRNLQPASEEIVIYSKSPFPWIAVVFSFLFACMITLANYDLWIDRKFDNVLILVAVFSGSYFAFWNILFWMSQNIQKLTWKRDTNCWRPLKVFVVTFGIISSINLLFLFLCMYPGNLTWDSMSQMTQLLSNNYSNHHPFYHTLVIKFFVSVGLHLFHDINAAVAVYSVFSILFMAAAFSFAVATIAELHTPKWIVVLLQLYFILMPYHIMYSMTMWKDVPFGASVLLFVLFFFRCMTGMRLKSFNYVGLVVSAFAICLFRSNGFFVFVFTALCFLLLWKFQKKAILFVIIAVLACSFVLKHPVLNAIGVTQPDLIESLSIPAQQIARDVVNHNDLTGEQRELLSQVIDLEQVHESYNRIISDPVKDLVRQKGNQEFIRSHAGDFIQLYVSRCIKNPLTYLCGYIDQTRGYWNAGYPYWRWHNGIELYDNNLGIYKTLNSETAHTFLLWYLGLFENQPALWIFLCIGFFDWLLLVALFTAIIRRDKLGIMLTIPNIMVVLSLLVATPVFSEFRYNYAVFCALPIVIVLVLRPNILLDFRREEKI